MPLSLARTGELEAQTDIRFHRWMWRVQRAGWILMLAVVAAALAGLFGSGPLSYATTASPDGAISVEYERYARSNAPTQFRVDFAVPAGEGAGRIAVHRETLDAMQIERVVPMPARVENSGEGVVYSFPVASGVDRARATFYVKVQGMGRLHARFSLPDGAALDCGVFAYP